MILKPKTCAVRRLGLSLGVLAAILGTGHAQAHYSFMTVDAPQNGTLVGTVVSSINDSGQTAGYYVNATPFGAAYSGFTSRADGSAFKTLSRAGAVGMGASGINNSGYIAGVSVDASFTATGFVRDSSGNYTTIDPSTGGLTSGYSEAVGLNNMGSVVGFYYESAPSASNPYPPEHGFLYQNGLYSQVDVPFGFDTELDSINDFGMMTGGFYDFSGNAQGFIYDPHTGFSQVFVPGFTQTSVSAINDMGQYLVGGMVVDNNNPTGYDTSSFLYYGGAYHPFAAPGAISTAAYCINNNGWVSGYYIAQDETIHGFVAIPTPEPTTVIPFAALSAGVVLRRRRIKRAASKQPTA